jgi:excisionase family DNA binding protein
MRFRVVPIPSRRPSRLGKTPIPWRIPVKWGSKLVTHNNVTLHIRVETQLNMTKSAENLDCGNGATTPLALDVHAAAKTLSVSEPTIRKLIRQARLPRIGGIRKILIPVAALQKFAASAE